MALLVVFPILLDLIVLRNVAPPFELLLPHGFLVLVPVLVRAVLVFWGLFLDRSDLQMSFVCTRCVFSSKEKGAFCTEVGPF